jgi:ribosome-associated protein
MADRVLRVDGRTAIPLDEIELRASRSSGPGGQHANVTASRIEAVFDVRRSTSLSDEQRARLLERCGSRITGVAQDARSQSRNRDLALERLRRRIAAALHVPATRHATRPTAGSKRRRLEAKRRDATRKSSRRRVDPGSD